MEVLGLQELHIGDISFGIRNPEFSWIVVSAIKSNQGRASHRSKSGEEKVTLPLGISEADFENAVRWQTETAIRSICRGSAHAQIALNATSS